MSATEQKRVPITLRVSDDGTLSLPREVCDEYGFEPGDTIEIEPELVGVRLVPVATDEEVEAFWGPNIWRELEEAEADIAAGRTTLHLSDEEFFAALEGWGRADPRGG